MTRLGLTFALAAILAVSYAHGSLTSTEYVVYNAGRAQCSGQVLGFNNRTCAAGTATRPAGPGVGPSLRPATATNSWTTFTLTLAGKGDSGGDLAVLSTFFAPASPAQPRCMGNLVAEKAAACADARVHIHPAAQAGADTPWLLVAAGDGTFNIVYTGRDDGCAVYLTASAACNTAAPFLAPADGSALQRWTLEPAAPAASPPAASPPPPPLAGQPPSLKVSSTSPTSAFVTVTPPAGGCAPVAYELSHKPVRSLNAPAVTTLRAGALTASLGNLRTGAAYTATAVGVCADGTRTPPSAPATFTCAPAAPACPNSPADRAGVELLAPGAAEDDYGGSTVAVDGDTAVFSAYGFGENAGRVVIFSRAEGAGWAWQQTLEGSGTANDYFGDTLALEGDDLIVTSWDVNGSQGAAWVFRRDGGGVWAQTQKLVSEYAADDAYFGRAMALRGGTLAIGALDELYIYKRQGAAWVNQKRFVPGTLGKQYGAGSSVAVDGDGATVVVAAREYNDNAGAVFVYTRTGPGGAWAEHQVLTVDKGEYARLGTSIAIDGGVILAAAPSSISQYPPPGSLYAFARSGANWAVAQHLLPPAGAAEFGLQAGANLAFSGGTAVVGDKNYASSSGGIFVFSWNGTGLEPKAGPGGSSVLVGPHPGGGSYFGRNVALSTGNAGAHCDTIMAGAYGADGPSGPSGQGAAFMYPLW